MSIALLRQMFEQMVEKKDPTAIDRFYHPSFVMFSNGVTQDFEAFAASHRTIYATPICYSAEYDEQAWVGTTDKVAGRVWITTSRPGDQPRLGDNVAQLEHAASIRDLLIWHAA
jgi:hypothetical protein